MDPRKNEVVKNWPRPLTPTNCFLGLTGYYRKFVEGFSSIAPLTTLTMKKPSPNEWRLVRRVSRSSRTDSLQPQCLGCLNVVRITLFIVTRLGFDWVVFLFRVIR